MLLDDTGKPEPVQSPFAARVAEQNRREGDRHAWKQGSAGWQSSANPYAAMMGGGGAANAETPAVVRGLDRGQGAGALVYCLHTGHTAGLFARDLADDTEHGERRLYHKQQFAGGDLACHPGDGRLVVSVADPATHTAHLGLLGGERPGVQVVTDGDCVDEAPAWCPPLGGSESSDAIVYQSAGVGRDANGNFWAVGPRRIEHLDLSSGEVVTLIDDAAFDHLTPRATADGSLWFVRRPYQSWRPATLWQRAKFFAASPFVFVAGLYGVVTGLSTAIKGEPPKTAGGPNRPPPPRAMQIYGAAVIAGKNRKDADDDLTPRAPKDWVLIRRDAEGNETEVATNVLSFDVADSAPSGVVLAATDGRDVFRLDPATGRREQLTRAALVDRVRLV